MLPVDGNSDGTISEDECFYDTMDVLVKAIEEDKYPSPPARDLYLVTKGVPEDPVVKAFLEYVLVKGQRLNVPAGYIGVSEEKIRRSLELLNPGTLQEETAQETEAEADE